MLQPYRKGKSERIDYGGVTFFRYPDSRQRENRVYFAPEASARKEGIQMLHVEIYKDNFGPIPAGAHVHHKDRNPLNNDPSNLGCLTPSEHSMEHVSDEWHAKLREEGKKRFQRYQKERNEWKKETEEGREWNRSHMKKMYEKAVQKRGESEIVCTICGETATRPNQRDGTPSLYCSTICNQTAFRRRAGIGTEPRAYACAVCGKAGVTTLRRQLYCSYECKVKAMNNRKKKP